MGSILDFQVLFDALTGHTPRHYQTELAALMAEGRLPDYLDVPTGMGKTQAVFVGWLHALLTEAPAARREGRPRRVPLRLHLAVDRRVVVDDSFTAAAVIAERLNTATSGPLADAASTLREALDVPQSEPVLDVIRLRGGADPTDPDTRNRLTEHTRHPGRPTIVVGTLDMLVSRLLFRGYLLSPRRRSIDAALTGTDTWWVLDEAHIATQAYTTLRTIQDYESPLENRFEETIPPFRVMAMTATHLPGATAPNGSAPGDIHHELTLAWDEPAELSLDPALSARLTARRSIPLRVAAGGNKELQEEAAKLLPTLSTGDAAVVFCTTIATAKEVFTHLHEQCKKLPVTPLLLTGGMPERLSQDRIAALGPYHTGSPDRAAAEPVIVVATSTLEVGADLDFTHLITQSADAPAMIQRLGRINRIGSRTDGSITVVRQESDPVYGDVVKYVVDALKPCKNLGEAIDILAERRADRAGIPLEVTGGSTSQLKDKATILLETLDHGDSALLYCHTKKAAEETFKHLETKCHPNGFKGTLLLLVSKDTECKPSKSEREKSLSPFTTGSSARADAKPVVVVAPSSKEVGEDLDFTHLITQSTDAPSLINQLNRVNQIGSRATGSVTIVEDEEGQATRLLGSSSTLGEALGALRSPAPALHAPQQVPAVIPPAVLGAYVRTAGSRNDAPVSTWIRPLEDPRDAVTVVIRDDAVLMDGPDGPALVEALDVLGIDARAEGWSVRRTDLDKLQHPGLAIDPSRAKPPAPLRPGVTPGIPAGHILVVSPEDGEKIVGTRVTDLSRRHVLAGVDATLSAIQEQLDTPPEADGALPHPVLTDLGGWRGDRTNADAMEEAATDLRTPDGFILETTVLGADSERPWLLIQLRRPVAEEARRTVPLAKHEEAVGELAGRWAAVIGLPSAVVNDIRAAGYAHDEGKRTTMFQQALAAEETEEGFLAVPRTAPGALLAKSALPRRLWRRSRQIAGIPDGWAHEAVSAAVLDDAAAARDSDPTIHDLMLVRHLVLTHHGRFRGPGPLVDRPTADNPYQCATAPQWRQQMLDFRELNRRYGPYTLSLAEAIVRLADWEVSRREQEMDSQGDGGQTATSGPTEPGQSATAVAHGQEQ